MSAVLCALCAIHVAGVLYFLVSRSDNSQGLNSLSLAAVELATGAVRAVHDFCRQGTNRAFRLCPVLIAN